MRSKLLLASRQINCCGESRRLPTSLLKALGVVLDGRLHDFEQMRDQRELLRVPIPYHTNAPQWFLPAQLVKSHSRHFEAQGRLGDQGNPHASSNKVKDGQDFICFLNDARN